MSTFTCDLEGFKKVTAEFCKAAPTADADELEAGFKCVGLHYLGITPTPAKGSAAEIMAVATLDYAARRKDERELQLMRTQREF